MSVTFVAFPPTPPPTEHPKLLLAAIIAHFEGMRRIDLDDAMFNTYHEYELGSLEVLRMRSAVNNLWAEFGAVLKLQDATIGDVLSTMGWGLHEASLLAAPRGKIAAHEVLKKLNYLDAHFYSDG